MPRQASRDEPDHRPSRQTGHRSAGRASTASTPAVRAEAVARGFLGGAVPPVAGAHLGAISEVFYTRLCAAVPELGTTLFNRSNQADRTRQQALAGSLAAFAGLLVPRQVADIDAIMACVAATPASPPRPRRWV